MDSDPRHDAGHGLALPADTDTQRWHVERTVVIDGHPVSWTVAEYLVAQKYDHDSKTWRDEPWWNPWKGLLCPCANPDPTSADTPAGEDRLRMDASLSCPAVAAARALRYAEVRAEYAGTLNRSWTEKQPDRHGVDGQPLRTHLDVSYDVYLRATRGEWIGQLRDAAMTIADLSGVHELHYGPGAWVTSLNNAKLLTLNGAYLIPWQQGEDSRVAMEQATGHADLKVSDFGWWRCNACGRHGADTDPGPGTVPCESEPGDRQDAS